MSWMSLSSCCSSAAVRTGLGTGSMPTITTTQVGRPQGAAGTCRATLEQHNPLRDGVTTPSVSHNHHSLTSGVLSPLAQPGQGQGQGAPGGIGSTRKVLPRQDQSLSRKPIPCLATHFPAVQTGTTFAPCANPRLCRKSPFGDTPALSQPPSQGLEGHWHQQRDWDICHHTASDKSLFPVLQYLCLPTGWCLGMANSSQIKNITSQWWCHFTDGIFQVAVQ